MSFHILTKRTFSGKQLTLPFFELSNAYNNMEDAFREDDQPDKWDITA